MAILMTRMRRSVSSFMHVLLATLLICVCVPSLLLAQDVFSSGDRVGQTGEGFDTGPCRDPQIAREESRQNARAYLDTDGRIKVAADYLARKYGDPYVNRSGACLHARGAVFLIPDRYDGEFRTILNGIREDGYESRSAARQRSNGDFGAGPTRLNNVSSTGCPYPSDIDPNRMSAMIPLEARINSAEAAFQQRLRLCRQGQGNLVKGGCASVCYGENRIAQQPVRPSPLRPLQGRVSNDVCVAPPKPETRFGLGDINEADPPLLVTAKLTQGWDDCAKRKFGASLVFLPVNYIMDRYRGLKTIMVTFGYIGSAHALVEDIDALRQPGESLGEASYRVGQLLCDGQDLRDILTRAGSTRVAQHFLRSAAPYVPRPTLREKRPLSITVQTTNNGFTPQDDAVLRAFARDNQILLILRNSNPYAARWMSYPGAVAKPMALKAKSLKPPSEPSRMTPVQRAAEKDYSAYYGLASARGLSAAERKAITDAGYLIKPRCEGEIITTRQGGYIYSDIDVHGIYDLKGNWAGSNAALRTLNGTTTGRFFQHGAQDDFVMRNDPKGSSFGPQPPVTVYTPNGPVHLGTMVEMRQFYMSNGINWKALYPLPLAQYRAVSGAP